MIRGGVVEATHAVDVVACDEAGGVVFASGDARLVTYYRSGAKPLQALPLVEERVVERFGLTDAELALCSASHQGEPGHVEGARSILAKAGLDASALACGPHPPYAESAARALAERGEAPRPIHNNCSGKHAGMLALAVAMGWPTEGYHLAEHPVQRRMLAEISRWSGVDPSAVLTGVDGCGVTCFAVPLEAIAGSFARFAAAAKRGEGAARIVGAMTAHPWMVGGTGRAGTEVMERAGGSVFVKVGAEGLYCGGIPARGIGFALKVRDGARRASDAALVGVLALLGVFEGEALAALAEVVNPPLRNTRGEVVGEIRARIERGTA